MAESDTRRVGVVGVGHIGKNHARLYAELPRGQFTAIFDTDEARAKELAEKYGYILAGSYNSKNGTSWEESQVILEKLLTDLQIISELLFPFMPETSSKIKTALKTKVAEPLFQRIK
jgi:lactate dehydrogenase-like 2-hydroxyacid dehydrogenase